MNPWAIEVQIVAAAGLGMSAFAAVNPRSQLFGPTLRETNRSQKLAITFDDGPNPAMTPKLLDLLARYNAKATFFLIGNFVTECPALAKEIVNRGHLIGNHTQTHPALALCGPEETQDELRRCGDAILEATWAQPRFFRPPYGLRNPWVGAVAARMGMKVVMWTLLPGDWRAPSAEWLIPRLQPVAGRVKARDAGGRGNLSAASGDILCLHDGSQRAQNTDRTATLKAVEYWLPRWRDLGLEFVTMDQAVETLVPSHG
jgi:peptidoglycan/xylan/chitin deacetylase (PgdA/CDA1 family)